jgi:SAM-dependent methyltransferase
VLGRFLRPPKAMLGSSVCRQSDFSQAWYKVWVQRIAAGAPALPADQEAVWGTVWAGMQGKFLHRKLWEWAAVAQALDERGMLAPGKSGIGFAVGQEPLPSMFASRGAKIVASDYSGGEALWQASGQLGASLEAIHWEGFLPLDTFKQRALFQNIDMRDLTSLPTDAFDFSWSSCSFEHLGSLEAGAEFIRQSMRIIRPGGVAVHTTEFNVSSNDQTVESGDSVIYRRRDIEALDHSLRLLGCGIERLDFDPGTGVHDLVYDRPPYYGEGRQHLKLELMGHVSTSILLIIRKG